MPADDFARLRAYYAVDPFGTERENMHFAMLAAEEHNRFQSLHVKKSRQNFVGPSRFMLGRQHQPTQSELDEQAQTKLAEHLLRGTTYDRSS